MGGSGTLLDGSGEGNWLALAALVELFGEEGRRVGVGLKVPLEDSESRMEDEGDGRTSLLGEEVLRGNEAAEVALLLREELSRIE